MSSLPVNATALFLSLTLVDDSGKKYSLNISSPNTGFSMSLQEISDGPTVASDGNLENPVALLDSSHDEINESVQTDDDSVHSKSPSEATNESSSSSSSSDSSEKGSVKVKVEPSTTPILDSFIESSSSEDEIEIVQPPKKPAPKKAPVKTRPPLAATRRSARARAPSRKVADEDEEMVGFQGRDRKFTPVDKFSQEFPESQA